MLRTYTREFGKAFYKALKKGGATCQGSPCQGTSRLQCCGCAEQQAVPATVTVNDEAANVMELFSAPCEDAWEDVQLSACVCIHTCLFVNALRQT